MLRRLVHFTSLVLASGILVAALVGAAAASTRTATVRVHTKRVSVPVVCPLASGGSSCRITVELRTTGRRIRSGVLVGRAKVLIAAGERTRVSVRLTRRGLRLLRQSSPLTLAATTTITTPLVPPSGSGSSTAPVSTPAPAPLCRPVGPPMLPAAGPGPTAAVGGIYIFGGPPNPSGCPPTSTPASPGTVQILNAAGAVVATQMVAGNQPFTIALPPGTYTIQAAPGGSDSYYCHGSGAFTVTEGNQTPVEVICSVP